MKFAKIRKEFMEVMKMPIKEFIKIRIDNVPITFLIGILLIGFGVGIIQPEITPLFFNFSPSIFARISSGLIYLTLGFFIIIKSIKRKFVKGEDRE